MGEKGNKFWEARSSHGRAPKFDTAESLWDACCQYFEYVVENPLYEAKAFSFQGQSWTENIPKMRAMTLDGLCTYIDITDQTWYNYKQRGDDFLDVINKVDRIIRTQKFEGAAADLLNANIIARDLGLRDSVDHSGSFDINKISDDELNTMLMAAIREYTSADKTAED